MRSIVYICFVIRLTNQPKYRSMECQSAIFHTFVHIHELAHTECMIILLSTHCVCVCVCYWNVCTLFSGDVYLPFGFSHYILQFENRMWSINENSKLHVQHSSVFVIAVLLLFISDGDEIFFLVCFSILYVEVVFFSFTTTTTQCLSHTISNWWFDSMLFLFILNCTIHTNKKNIDRISTLAYVLIVTRQSNFKTHSESRGREKKDIKNTTV